jgi:ribosomal RNA-processing protein 36
MKQCKPPRCSALIDIAEQVVADKKSLIMRARYEALAATGKGAVKKAIEKKQKKRNQKEKRSRPFGRGQMKEDTSNVESKKRRLASGSYIESGKRRRMG